MAGANIIKETLPEFNAVLDKITIVIFMTLNLPQNGSNLLQYDINYHGILTLLKVGLKLP